MLLQIRPTRIGRALLYITVATFVVTLVRSVLVYKYGRPTLFGLAKLLSPDQEANLLSWYSSSLLLLASLMLALIAAEMRQDGNRHAWNWMMLAAVFLFLSADEAACIHERFGGRPMAFIPTSGYLLYAWVIPWGAMAAVVALLSVKLLLSLPRQVRTLFMFGGSIYVGGAIGVEILTAEYVTIHTSPDLIYSLLVDIEEFMETVGASAFIYGLGLLMESRTVESESGVRARLTHVPATVEFR